MSSVPAVADQAGWQSRVCRLPPSAAPLRRRRLPGRRRCRGRSRRAPRPTRTRVGRLPAAPAIDRRSAALPRRRWTQLQPPHWARLHRRRGARAAPADGGRSRRGAARPAASVPAVPVVHPPQHRQLDAERARWPGSRSRPSAAGAPPLRALRPRRGSRLRRGQPRATRGDAAPRSRSRPARAASSPSPGSRSSS